MSEKKHSFLSIALMMLIMLTAVGCKKDATSPAVEDLTRPVIWLNMFEIGFQALEAGGNPAPQVLKVKNSGINTLEYSLSDDVEWLQIQPAGGTSSGQMVSHQVIIDKSGMKARNEPYSALITISSGEGYNSPQTVAVNLNISKQAPPKIWVNPKTISLNAQESGANPTIRDLIINNTGPGTLNYTITSDVPWLRVQPPSGQSQGTAQSHSIKANIVNMGSGSYKGVLSINSNSAANSPQTVNITLDITQEPPPKIWTHTGAMTIEAAVGGNNPTRNLDVRNSGGGILKYVLNSDESWLRVYPTGGTSSGEIKSHQVTAQIDGLSAGTYHANITCVDSRAANNPQVVSVTLKLNTPPTPNRIGLDINPSSAVKDSTISVPISIGGNALEIKAFGLTMSYDTNMFEFQGVDKGSLTGSFASVAGYGTGVINIGGFGGGSTIPVGSSGSIAVAHFKVIGSGFSNGDNSTITISSYKDDISGMSPSSCSVSFTYKE